MPESNGFSNAGRTFKFTKADGTNVAADWVESHSFVTQPGWHYSNDLALVKLNRDIRTSHLRRDARTPRQRKAQERSASRVRSSCEAWTLSRYTVNGQGDRWLKGNVPNKVTNTVEVTGAAYLEFF